MSVPAFIPRTISHTYVVGWPDHGIVKVGSTDRGRRRWGPFLCRGGVMAGEAACCLTLGACGGAATAKTQIAACGAGSTPGRKPL